VTLTTRVEASAAPDRNTRILYHDTLLTDNIPRYYGPSRTC